MGQRSFARWVLLIGIVGAATQAGGCGKKNPIDGTYQDSSGIMKFDFHSGNCDVTIPGVTREYTYAVSGNMVTIKPKKGINGMTFKIQPDGSLVDTATGNTLTKKK